GKPDVKFSLSTNTNLRESVSDSMPNRLPKVREYMRMAGGRVMRSAPVQLGEMKADELLLEGPFVNSVKGHDFLLEANATTGGPETPFLTFKMRNGARSFLFPEFEQVQRASLTDNEAVAVWDVISRTVRPRPNGF
ncbi:T6SS immunity protein Tli4 family protein, partial [Paraburkholderia sp.]|uniref:T6SS immunity protein Tli4 family protein n=1 Tax=Paraburkholderia sp. TaxID=1926495 RepID=UPI0025E0C40D